MKTRLLPLLSLPLLLLAACGGDDRPEGENQQLPPQPIEKSSALVAANANLRSVLTGSARSAVFIDDGKLVGDVLDMAGDCASADPLPGEPMEPTDCVSFDFETSASTVADDVAAKFLNVANVESEEPTKVTLKIDPVRACGSDAECVQAFTEVPLRIELTTRGENKIDLDFLVGEGRANPIDLKLYPNELAIEVDLGAAREAFVRFMIALGQSADDLPDIMNGRVRFAITKHAESDYSMAFAVLSAVEVGGGEGDDAYLFELGVANPAASVRIDAAAEQVTASTGFGKISGTIPLSSMFSDTTMGNALFELGALKMSSTLKAGEENVVVDGIDFGTGFSLTANGQPIIAADADVRRVEVSSTATGMIVSVSPSLVANISLDYRNLPNGAAADMPAWALDEDLTLEFNGAASPSVEIAEESGNIKVTAGQLAIRSRATGTAVTVAAGMCLIAEDQEPTDPNDPNGMGGEETHPIEALSSGTCPSM